MCPSTDTSLSAKKWSSSGNWRARACAFGVTPPALPGALLSSNSSSAGEPSPRGSLPKIWS